MKHSYNFVMLCTIFSKIAGAWAAVFGALILTGWTFDIATLKSIRPDLISIKANTALSFLMAGISLLLLQNGKKITTVRFWPGKILALAVTLVGFLTLLEHLLDMDIGLDQLLVAENVSQGSGVFPGRMAPTTAITFVLLGLALLVLDTKTSNGKRPAESLAILSFFNALVGFTAYFYSISTFGGITPSAQTALYTVMTVLVLSLGILGARSDQGIMAVVTADTFGGTTARRLLPLALLLPLLLGYLKLKGEITGLYGPELGLALLVLSTIVIFTILIWKYAKTLDHADAERKKLERAKEEFVSLASHQLRTPLTAIGGYASMLLEGNAGAVSKKQKEFLRVIEESNKKMLDLVAALLNVSRIDLGVFAIEPIPFNVLEAAESTINELLLPIQEKGLGLDKKFGRDIPLMNADPKLMGILFQNLLSNAVKYTPEGGNITFEITKKEPDLFIRVSDTGMGIPKNQQEKIFSKLFRADNAMQKISEGTGLGLYIVKSVVEVSGGRIWFVSEENQGTTFYVTLPLTGMKKREGAKGLT